MGGKLAKISVKGTKRSRNWCGPRTTVPNDESAAERMEMADSLETDDENFSPPNTSRLVKFCANPNDTPIIIQANTEQTINSIVTKYLQKKEPVTRLRYSIFIDKDQYFLYFDDLKVRVSLKVDGNVRSVLVEVVDQRQFDKPYSTDTVPLNHVFSRVFCTCLRSITRGPWTSYWFSSDSWALCDSLLTQLKVQSAKPAESFAKNVSIVHQAQEI